MKYIVTGKGGERAIIDIDDLNKWLSDNPAMKDCGILPYWVYEQKRLKRVKN